tara:strand:- start:14705 stop:17503 length:2799 start_codon:yes stop_codon:yes gene_type:complete
MADTEFQIISWESEDRDDEFTITMYGRNRRGQSIACHTRFTPYLYVESKGSDTDIRKILMDGMEKCSVRNEDGMWSKKNLYSHVLACKPMWLKKFFGFTNNKQFKFFRISFQSKEAWKKAHYLLKNSKYKNNIYEANIDPMLRFIHYQDIQTTGWVIVNSPILLNDDEKYSSCDVEWSTRKFTDVKASEHEDIGPIVIASFDIETYSPDGSFPDPTKHGCEIIQIATSYMIYGEKEPYLKELLTLNSCDPIEGSRVVTFTNESSLLKGWVSSIFKNDPDIIVGYNIWKFDLEYIYKRAKYNGIETCISLNRNKTRNSRMYSAKFSSSAYGDNEYNMVSSEGRIQIDLLELYKREHKLVSYSLNSVSEHFLGDKKVDMPIPEMFERYRQGTAKDMRAIGEYCIKDTVLPLKLMSRLNDIPNLIEMAKATYVPMNFLIERGQQIKVFSQVARQTRLEDMLIITTSNTNTSDSFIGATVLNAEKGSYMNEVVTGLDFASLYPTIMRAHNICYNTIVLDDEYAELDDVVYETVEWETESVSHKYKFSQSVQGILPKILENLAKSRKKAKKDMANAKDPFMKSVFNGKQLAFKVSMNSIYGFCAAHLLQCKPISACVTTIGRNMIDHTKQLVESWYPGSRVIYGDTDSVMVIFNPEGRQGQDMLEHSFRLGKEAADRISTTFKQPIELEFEKCYWPYLLFSKKRYCGLMYTSPEKPDYIDIKGLQVVRRDCAPFVKDISRNILDTIMYEKDVHKAMEQAKQLGQRLLDGKLPIDQLVVSKSMRKDYKNKNQPHLEVARKLDERNPGSGPKCGERVPYVFIETKNKNDLQFKKAEDPTYAQEHNIPIDLIYYMEHSLFNPIQSLFEVFIPNPSKRLFGDMIDAYKKKKTGQTDIDTFFKSVEKKQVDTLKIQKPISSKEKPSSSKQKTTSQRTITLFL